MSSTVRETVKYGQEKLEAAGKSSASFDARALLSFVMDIPFRNVPLKYQEVVTDEQRVRYDKLLDRRLSGEPLQYITGGQEFMGLTFHVDPRVLIPRLDTEILAEEALKYVNGPDGKNGLRVLDLCCGSGAIGLSIAKLADPERIIEVVLSDISEDALKAAGQNAEALGITDNVTFIKSDLFTEIDGRFDLIVSNPPYVRSDIIETLDTEVKDHEPMLALDGGADGLDVYRRIIEEAPDHLNYGGSLMMEIGFDQAEDIKQMLTEEGRYTDLKIRKDLAGLDRVVSARNCSRTA